MRRTFHNMMNSFPKKFARARYELTPERKREKFLAACYEVIQKKKKNVQAHLLENPYGKLVLLEKLDFAEERFFNLFRAPRYPYYVPKDFKLFFVGDMLSGFSQKIKEILELDVCPRILIEGGTTSASNRVLILISVLTPEQLNMKKWTPQPEPTEEE